MARIAAKASKGKGKRWQKGSSSTCNPQSKKHRSRVSESLLGANSNVTSSNQSFKLTKDLLEKFDAIQLQKLKIQDAETSTPPISAGIDNWLSAQRDLMEKSEVMENLETRSIGAVSAASVWTNCTNVTFDRFLNGFDAKSTMHKAMLAVLATVREAIEFEKGSETETEYFAGLMLALNCVDSEEKLTATISLIQIVLPKVPSSVLKLKFAETAQTLLKILHDRIDSTNVYLIKAIIKTLAGLLQEQEEPAWQSTIASKTFQLILEMILHPKPRIRKTAQFAVNSIINNKKQEPPMVARNILAQFCISKLEKHLKTSQDQHLQTLLYISTIMSQTFHRFPNVESTKKASEAILSHMTFGNVLVINGALQTFYCFFMEQPTSEVLSPELNAQLLNALYDYQPNINDEQPLNAWLLAMGQGLLSLHRLDRKLSHSHLFKFIKNCVLCFASDSKQVQASVSSIIQQLFSEIVVQNEFDHDKRMRFYEEIENCLKYQYANSWLRAIPMISQLQLPNGEQYLFPIWQRLAILHEPKESELNTAIDHCFAQAIKTFGPKPILDHVQITWQYCRTLPSLDRVEGEITGEFTNAWLLPILRDSIHDKGEIGLFVDHFGPIADELSKKAQHFNKVATKMRQQLNQSMDTDDTSNDTLFKSHEAIIISCKELKRCVRALWALLPSLCRSPIDVPTYFPKIAKRLGELFNDKEFIIYSSNSLKNLLSCPKPEVQSMLSKFAKNYLPILFNVYTDEQGHIEEGHRGQILWIIQKFIHLLFYSDDQTKLFRTFFEKIKERLNEPSSDARRKALLDLLNAFLSSPKGLTRQDVEELYKTIAVPLIVNGSSSSDQKKGFKIIEQLVVSQSEDVQSFVNDNLQSCLEFLHGLLSGKDSKKAFTSASTTAFAMRTLKQLISKLEGNSEMFKRLFQTFLPIIYDAFNLKSAKAVRTAEELLLTIFDAAESQAQDSEQLMMEIIEPLKQDDLHIDERTGRIRAISFLYSKRFSEKSITLQCRIADIILSQMILSRKDEAVSGNILRVCFDFVNLFLKTKTEIVAPYLERITTALTNLPQTQRLKYRLKIKVLLTKLGRKFGFDMVSKCVPEDYKKVLKSIRKLEAAKKKKKTDEKDGENDDDDDEDDREDDKKSRKSRKSRVSRVSSDDDEHDIKEFMNDEWNTTERMDDSDNDDDEDDKKSFRSKKFDIMSKISTKTSKCFLKENAGDPVDLLSPAASKQIFSKIPKRARPSEDTENDKNNKNAKRGKRTRDDGNDELQQLISKLSTPKKRNVMRKDDDDDDDED